MAALLCVSLASNARAGSIVQGPIFDPNSNMYLYVISKDSWTNSEAYAVSLGGHLVTIASRRR